MQGSFVDKRDSLCRSLLNRTSPPRFRAGIVRQANVANPKKGQKRDLLDDLPLKGDILRGEETCGEMLVLDSLLLHSPFLPCLSHGIAYPSASFNI